MKYLKRIISLLVIVTLISGLQAQENPEQVSGEDFTPGLAIAIKISTFGPGIELIKSFNKSFCIRLGASYFPQKFSAKLTDVWNVNTVNDVRLGAVNLFADWQFKKDMHLTAGLLYNMNWYKVTAHPVAELQMGEATISPETLGSISYAFEPNTFCPYLGIGYGKSISRNKLLSFSLDVGAVYQGSPKAMLEATGMVSPTASEEQRKM